MIERTSAFQATLDEHNIPLTVFPSQEVRINGGLMTALDEHDILTTDAQGTYVLIEFPSDDVPNFTMDMLFQIQQRGMVPVIVHPERNTRLMKEPQLLYDMVSRGSYAQVTSSSYLGTFGKAVSTFAEDIISNGLAHVFASDAHHIPGRSYEMTAAFNKLRETHGGEIANKFEENAKALVNGERLSRFSQTPIKKKCFFSPY